MLTVTSEVMVAEIELAERILAKWKAAIQIGIPAVEAPGSEEDLEDFIRKLCGELMVVSGKCETLAAVVGEGAR